MYFKIDEFLTDHPEMELIHKKNDGAALVRTPEGKAVSYDLARANSYNQREIIARGNAKEASATKTALDARTAQLLKRGEDMGWADVYSPTKEQMDAVAHKFGVTPLQAKRDFQLFKSIKATEKSKAGFQAAADITAKAEADRMERLGKGSSVTEATSAGKIVLGKPKSGLPSDN